MIAILDALAWALLHFVWQGAAIAFLLAVFSPALERQSAARRADAACLALLAMALAPVVTFFLLWTPAPAVTVPAALAPSPDPFATARLALVLAWAAGVLLFVVRLAGGLVVLRRLARTAVPVPDRWTRAAHRLASRLAVPTSFRLLASTRVTVPLTFGWWKPVILLPAAALANVPPEYLEALLAHELAHLRRRDYLVNLLQSLVEAVLFYHPAVWWVSARVREAREHACDDLAAAALDDRVLLAEALLSLETARAAHPALASAANGGPLMRRIRRLVAPAPAPSRLRAWTAPLVLLAALVPAAALALSAVLAPAPERTRETIDIAWMPPALDPWRAEIAAAAERHGIDPELLAIVVLVESAGNADAKSTGGALGLMQVMPETGRRIAEARGETGFEPAKLREPAYNLDAGAWYLARQLEEFGAGRDDDGAVDLAAAAYNGGPRRLRASLAGEAEDSEETRRYRALVTALWKERGAEHSPSLEAWRTRALERVHGRTVDPLPGARVSLPFQALTPDLGGGRRVHEGVDLAAPAGAEILAPLPGVVRIATPGGGDAGTIVVVDHGKGLETRWHHLGELRVESGEKVRAGSVLGTVGTTGKTTGPHVHLEVRDLGRPVDPLMLLPAP